MRMLILLFEISDKIIGIEVMYVLFIALGCIGLLLGFWRWWLSAIWLIFPTALIAAGFILLQTEEINYLYKDIIREVGERYIWHNYISVITGISLNLAGLFVGFVRSKKINLQ